MENRYVDTAVLTRKDKPEAGGHSRACPCPPGLYDSLSSAKPASTPTIYLGDCCPQCPLLTPPALSFLTAVSGPGLLPDSLRCLPPSPDLGLWLLTA